MVVDAGGPRPAADATDLRAHVEAGEFFWLDIFAADQVAGARLLDRLTIDAADAAWALRFGQTGRMQIGRGKLRAVTWMAEPSGRVVEVHVFSTHGYMLTAWQGDASALDEIRMQFSERVGGLDKSFYHAAGILLQLLLGTLDRAIVEVDLGLDNLRIQLDKDSGSADFALLARRVQKLQSTVGGFSRYSSAVRSAIVGVEAVSGMDECGAAALIEYAEQVEDVEEQLFERRRWMSDVMHDYSTAIAQRQGEQINRLTLVSLIFLPVTALTGFFGMNFNWMIGHIDGAEAFLTLGVLMPALSVILTVVWFKRRGLIQISLWPPAIGLRAAASNRAEPARERTKTSDSVAVSDLNPFEESEKSPGH